MLETETKTPSNEQEIKLHPKQGKAYKSRKRIVYCSSGIQGGKSLVGAIKLRWAVKKGWPAEKFPQVNFAVCAPDYKSMTQSTRQAFDKVFQGAGTMNEMKQEFTLNDGRKIYFRTMVKNPNAVEGIPSCVFIWGDEAGQYPRMAYLNLQARTAFMQGQVFLTSTPYAYTWPKQEIMDRWRAQDPDIDYFEWLSVENPAFPKEEFDRQKQLLSQKEFERKYMGMHSRLEGLIFEDFGPKNWVTHRDAPLLGAKYIAGVDWGFDHPMGIIVLGIVEDWATCVSITKMPGLSVSQQIDLLEAKKKTFGIEAFSCGHDRPEMILELQKRRMTAHKYFEYHPEYREVDAGNAKVAELMKTGKLRFIDDIEGGEDLEDELETYHWGEPTVEGGKAKPVDTNNDLISALRYATIEATSLLTLKLEKPKLPLGYMSKVDSWTPAKPAGHHTDWY